MSHSLSASPSAAAFARTGLPPAAIAAIQQVLADHPAVEQAILNGSRALGRYRPASDIDLTLIGSDLSATSLSRVESEPDDLLLPWVIDLSRYASLTHPGLLAHIERVGQVMVQRASLPPVPPAPSPGHT